MSRVIAATIRNGHAVADELATLPDGTVVEVATPADDSELTATELAELEAADDEIERGEFVTADELFKRLDDRAAHLASR